MSWSSEAIKHSIFPSKNMSAMTEQDWFEFRNQLDPDIMGFDGVEGYLVDDNEEEQVSQLISTLNPFKINDNLTTRNYTDGKGVSRIKYIVVHYTANNGDSAWGNTNYFKSTYRGASAHYFVDENSIWRCVQDKDISWHCGGGLQGSNGHTYYKKCLNSNSIGIEMCSRKYSNGQYYFKEQTISNCIQLVKYLMDKYNIPVNNVIRHYDVTGKICPEPFVRNANDWNNFKNNLTKNYETKPGIYSVVDCSILNVRNGNSTNYAKIGTLKLGDKVTITEFNNGWGKITYNNSVGWVCMTYMRFVSEISIHWAQSFFDTLVYKGMITDKSVWSKFDSPTTKGLVICLLDKMTGGIWLSNEDNPNIHWAQPNVISLCGKGVINQPDDWVYTLDNNMSKALLLALCCNIKGGVSDLYKNRMTDHWARNCLDTLCDKGIISTPSSWTDFESEVSVGQILALLCKTLYN